MEIFKNTKMEILETDMRYHEFAAILGVTE